MFDHVSQDSGIIEMVGKPINENINTCLEKVIQ